MRKIPEAEKMKLVRAKRQLLVTGVLCVALTIFTLWLTSLPRTFAKNRGKYASPFTAIKEQVRTWKISP